MVTGRSSAKRMRPGKQSVPAQGPRWNLQSESSIHQRAWSRGQDASRGGGGIGAIEIEPLKAGMARAIDVELTPTNEAAARELLVRSTSPRLKSSCPRYGCGWVCHFGSGCARADPAPQR